MAIFRVLVYYIKIRPNQSKSGEATKNMSNRKDMEVEKKNGCNSSTNRTKHELLKSRIQDFNTLIKLGFHKTESISAIQTTKILVMLSKF